jgi:threonine/homoserine/homoserine lactone efflux protein
MRVGDFTLLALVTLAVLSYVGAWLWTRADRKKNAADRAGPKP